jgi:SEC-C motif domain protein
MTEDIASPTLCPCGSEIDYEGCCSPIHRGEQTAPTAEALLRSRYAAFVKGNVEHLINTAHPKIREELDEESLRSWANDSKWLGLEILGSHLGDPDDEDGVVEFVAHYQNAEGETVDHHERSLFKKEDGAWYFLDGEPAVQEPYRREEPKLGRNDPCHCGSGKKFKKCHGRAA